MLDLPLTPTFEGSTRNQLLNVTGDSAFRGVQLFCELRECCFIGSNYYGECIPNRRGNSCGQSWESPFLDGAIEITEEKNAVDLFQTCQYSHGKRQKNISRSTTETYYSVLFSSIDIISAGEHTVLERSRNLFDG